MSYCNTGKTGQVNVTCASDGWSPKATVLWTIYKEGKEIPINDSHIFTIGKYMKFFVYLKNIEVQEHR